MDTPIIPQKQCTKCKQYYPPTTEYFHRDSRGLYGLKSKCKMCIKEYDSERLSNPEIRSHMKETRLIWGESNKSKLAEIERRYYKNNTIEIRKREKVLGKIRRKRFNDAHPKHSNKTRIRRAGAIGTYTEKDIDLQFKIQKGKCWWCGNELEKDWHIDHRIPLIKGGTNWPNNIVCSCKHCNLSKGGKMPHEWNGRLL